MAKLLLLTAVCVMIFSASNALEFKDCGESPIFSDCGFYFVEIIFFFWNTFIANRDLKMRRIKKIVVEKSQVQNDFSQFCGFDLVKESPDKHLDSRNITFGQRLFQKYGFITDESLQKKIFIVYWMNLFMSSIVFVVCHEVYLKTKPSTQKNQPKLLC